MLNIVKNKSRDFIKDEDGATAIEYGLIAALISVAIIGAVSILGGGLAGTFEDINTELGFEAAEED